MTTVKLKLHLPTTMVNSGIMYATHKTMVNAFMEVFAKRIRQLSSIVREQNSNLSNYYRNVSFKILL